jgi:hypothetical protein
VRQLLRPAVSVNCHMLRLSLLSVLQRAVSRQQ